MNAQPVWTRHGAVSWSSRRNWRPSARLLRNAEVRWPGHATLRTAPTRLARRPKRTCSQARTESRRCRSGATPCPDASRHCWRRSWHTRTSSRAWPRQARELVLVCQLLLQQCLDASGHGVAPDLQRLDSVLACEQVRFGLLASLVGAVLSVACPGQRTSAFRKSLAEGRQFLLELHDTAPCRVQTGCAFMLDRKAAFLLHDHRLQPRLILFQIALSLLDATQELTSLMTRVRHRLRLVSSQPQSFGSLRLEPGKLGRVLARKRVFDRPTQRPHRKRAVDDKSVFAVHLVEVVAMLAGEHQS